MLLELRVKELALVEEVAVNFEPGFNVLTGETGAGKTLLVEALELLVGERSDRDMVRKGAKNAFVEGIFNLTPALRNSLKAVLGEDPGEEVILSRSVDVEGGSKAYLNGRRVPSSLLKEVGKFLVDIHGQHEHQSLLFPSNHLYFLDSFFQEKISDLKKKYSSLFEEILDLRKQFEELQELEGERLKRIDALRFEVEEIEKAGLREGEEEELRNERNILQNFARLSESIQRICFLLDGEEGALDKLREVQSLLEEISAYDQELKEKEENFKEALFKAEEVSSFFHSYAETLEYNPERLNQVEERLYLISRLKKKYGESVKEIENYKKEALAELDKLENLDFEREQVEKKLKEKERLLRELAQEISEKRQEAAVKLEDEVKGIFARLGMEKSIFKVNFAPLEKGVFINGSYYGRSGKEKIEFLLSPSVEDELRPLKKVVSGGELSRIMLALKRVFSKVDNVPLLVFDEVDAGIGGKTAVYVGKLLKEISLNHQVICVTHLPQIASLADSHILVYQEERGRRVITKVKRVDREERIKEIARLLSGEESKTALKHAQELLSHET
jgi:DNA repair protein RecN (Recombination protein N)